MRKRASNIHLEIKTSTSTRISKWKTSKCEFFSAFLDSLLPATSVEPTFKLFDMIKPNKSDKRTKDQVSHSFEVLSRI